MRDLIIDVANETQRDMIVFRIDPTRARQAAAQHGERLTDIIWDFETGEDARHGTNLA